METKVLLIVDESGTVEPENVIIGSGYGEIDAPYLGDSMEIKGWGELDGHARELVDRHDNVVGYMPCFI